MRLFFVAFQFLTIIPLPFAVRCQEKDLGRSMALFPLVGLALGAGLVGLDFILTPLFPRAVADLILIMALAGVTGALHLDGLADVCDGLAARGSRERFLEVMKDSRVGPVGAVGLLFGLLLKYQALQHIPPEMKREALLLFPLLARYSQVQLTVGARRARLDGLGAAFIGGAGTGQLAVAALLGCSISFLFLGTGGFVCFGVVASASWLLKGWFQRRLGGITGDIIGCVSELNEIAALLTILALGRL